MNAKAIQQRTKKKAELRERYQDQACFNNSDLDWLSTVNCIQVVTNGQISPSPPVILDKKQKCRVNQCCQQLMDENVLLKHRIKDLEQQLEQQK